jgi:NitT/TauT family transport system substrate-binding protein
MGVALTNILKGVLMHDQRADHVSRRKFLEGMTLATTAGLLGVRAASASVAPPPETTALRVIQAPSLCQAPQLVAAELLRDEGFSNLTYVKRSGAEVYQALATGEADMAMQFSGPNIIRVDRGDPIVILAGIHIGCFELFGTDRVRAVHDLKGKNVAVFSLGSPPHVFLSVIAAYVGLDPSQDINWVTAPEAESVQLLAEGKIDALLLFPPYPQELRAKQIGHVVLNSMMDRPWSQYFCCMTIGNREFVHKHPVATKRALRAILKATDLCASAPERVARSLVDKGYTPRYDYALQTLQEIPYGRWREYNPEDTVRFYALRLYELGMIQSSPQKILARGTEWHFLDELKRELKG